MLGFVLISLALIFANFISKSITKPIDKLLVGIKKMGQGNFSTKVEVKRNDEIGNLVKKFNEMDDKILNLIEENYISNIREKEEIIMSLNIQLNPHFLYNTLNIINWIAIENDEKEISKMIVSLSSMLQYTAHNTEEISDFKTDLEWLKKYIYIMQNRFEDKFNVYYEIDERINLYKVPKLFLQPFVENSIWHGIMLKQSQEGWVKITLNDSGSFIRCVIEDNGIGRKQADEIRQLRNKEHKSRGSQITQQRIELLSLMYKEKFNIQYEDLTDHLGVYLGTRVSITFPKEINVNIQL